MNAMEQYKSHVAAQAGLAADLDKHLSELISRKRQAESRVTEVSEEIAECERAIKALGAWATDKAKAPR